jgi:hypothetical protein
MTNASLTTALEYAARGWPVFPCHSEGSLRKRPLTHNGFHGASTDRARIETWWRWRPDALIGVPTGKLIGAVVLDIDTKDDQCNGYDTLEDLGHSILPETPMSHTASRGVHVWFANPERELKCSAGLIGPGVDVRATGGYVIVPSPGSGYEWDPICNFDTVPLAQAPDWLWPVKPSRPPSNAPISPVVGLSPYGKAAIAHACDAIVRAGPGRGPGQGQECTLNSECYNIGTLAGAGGVPQDIALRALLRAAHTMPDYEPDYPWRPEEIEAKVKRAFQEGMKNPREARRAVA